MTNVDKTLEKLLDLAATLDEKRVSVDDFVPLMEGLMTFAKETRDLTEAELVRLVSLTDEVLAEIKAENKKTLKISTDVLEKIKDNISKEVDKRTKEQEKRIGDAIRDIPPPEKGDPGEDASAKEVAEFLKTDEEFIDLVQGEDGDLIEAETVRDKLASLEGEERLDHTAIKGLEDRLKALQGTFKGMIPTPRYAPKPYEDDLSGSTDGSTKTFTLTKAPDTSYPQNLRGSDFPYALRPTIDFTVANKTLTLTDEVDAPMSGATLIFSYFQ
jgi:hypothetical protein